MGMDAGEQISGALACSAAKDVGGDRRQGFAPQWLGRSLWRRLFGDADRQREMLEDEPDPIEMSQQLAEL